MKPRVLIADANRSLCDSYQRFLSGFGCIVETVPGGLECVARLPLFLPDVLILDLQLPWGGADGVLAWLGEAGIPQAVPAVILIGEAVPSAVIESILKSPAVKVYHQKPIPPPALLEAVCDLAQRQRGQQPAPAGEAMSQPGCGRPAQGAEGKDHPPGLEIECLEVPLLMPGWQLAALARAAARQELTTGQLLRQVIGTYLAGLADSRVQKENHSRTEQRGTVQKGVRA